MRPAHALLLTLVVLAGCGGDELGTSELEQKIRVEFERGADRENVGAVSVQEEVRIQGVVCVRKDASDATCVVRAVGPDGPERLDLQVDIDPGTGEYTWREADG